MKRCIAFVGLLTALSLHAQSPWTNTTFPAAVLTASSQTSTPIKLGANRDSYSAGTITLIANNLTTATFQVLGSADNGTTYNPIAIQTCTVPGTFATSETATATGCYQVNLAGLYYVKFSTTGTFTGTSISLILTASPNSMISRSGGGGGGGGGCTGASGIYPLNNQVATLNSGCVTSIGSAFSMGASCPQAGQRETGNATTNPFTCTLSYANGTPASATLGDGTNTDTLSSPYTAASLAFAYSTATTFTAHSTATSSQSASATASISFTPRTFGGVGDNGTATGATASGTSAVLVGDTGTLASAGLGIQASYGPYTLANQYLYLLFPSSSCTFSSEGFNFPMTSIAITFVNQYGSSISSTMYISVNSLNDTFTVVPSC